MPLVSARGPVLELHVDGVWIDATRFLPVGWRGFEWKYFNAFNRRRWKPLDRRHHRRPVNRLAIHHVPPPCSCDPTKRPRWEDFRCFRRSVDYATRAGWSRARMARMHAAYRRRTR